ncbi:Holliday junction DNA helicase subunit RuvA [Desulfuromonas soudanensis]|uniref:Holliday junction branch migration complex subunit RuvA n=1 Tax=Desulfuromonas soudanensis TaxID=1603606 RepID=A0A0M4DB10_9BACT|nr:Holliday junction branch migration protein RuvA [Desulfuromonas soudanensis]ALC17455.1 Holliday junction DNA helicase subunit RuvA [Desulfuromonas soudanensis]
MISLLTGEVAYKSIDHIIVDVGGVGYRLHIPLSTYYALPDDGTVRLHVHTHVREDAIHLFGFFTDDEKAMFLLLITISGVGPKLALNILSHIPTAALRTALAEGDAKRLATLPGIGKKTAERLILELREKVVRTAGAPPGAARAGDGKGENAPMEDILSALTNLGYKEGLARKVLETLEISPGAGLEEILKGALKVLAK